MSYAQVSVRGTGVVPRRAIPPVTNYYKHVAIGIATMTVHDSQPDQVSRFIILSN